MRCLFKRDVIKLVASRGIGIEVFNILLRADDLFAVKGEYHGVLFNDELLRFFINGGTILFRCT